MIGPQRKAKFSGVTQWPTNIFLIQGKDQLVQMESQPYDSEALLQTLLAKFPDLPAGGQIDSAFPRQWLQY